MRFARKLIGISAVAVACLAFVIPTVRHRIRTANPTKEMESDFLKGYTPESAAEQFLSQGIAPQWATSVKSASGKEFASHQRDFHGQIAIDSRNWMALMSSMSGDVSAQLLRCGAQILNQSGEARDGFRFDYKLGKTLGSVVISPLKIISVKSGSTDNLRVAVDVSIEEKHFHEEPGLITVRVFERTY